MHLEIPLFDETYAGHASFAMFLPLFVLLVAGGVIGFKRPRLKSMLTGALFIAGLGYCSIGVWGCSVTGLMPLMYIWARS